jgi:dipeptidyl aminopeptidase/acylaminoacyl peptidase
VTTQTARYGTWPSPITARAVAASSLRLGHVVLEDHDIYWVEGRPAEGGRSVVVRRSADGAIADATPPGANVRTRVQEYGGAAYTVSRGTIYYSELSDQRLYRFKASGAPESAAPITPAGNWCYADFTIDASRGRLVCVREDHTIPGSEAQTTLVMLGVDRVGRLDGPPAPPVVIASGYDFYSTPRFNPDGTQLSWLAWRHPQMPWDGTELWVADVTDEGRLEHARQIAGSETESIVQPGWSPDGTLYFVSDRTGWWNLYRTGLPTPVYPIDAECGRPQWMLGTSTWTFAGPSTLVIACAERGTWRLFGFTPREDAAPLTDADRRPLTDLEPGELLAATAEHVVFIAGSPRTHDAVVRFDLATGRTERIRSASTSPVNPDALSVPLAIEFPTEASRTAHAFFYPPRNTAFTAPADERPPLIVVSHGGPTAATTGRLNLEIQFWTSRGFAVVDVNYGGSSGYGRAYRERLNGQWGIVDVDDCVNAALHLASRGLADRERLLIRGRSAGGFTTLAALAFHPRVFKAGASYYGVADLELLARDTHKFESRYLDRLVGPYPARQDLYRARSPIHSADRLSCPIIFFQGLDDRVVPPEQAENMAAAVRAKGLTVSLVTFPGEAHGFRKAETIAHCLEEEAAFYARVLEAAIPI